MTQPLVVMNAVGLTSRLLPSAPRLIGLAERGWKKTLVEVLPAVTCTAQASMLTGATPQEHGVVANGWLYRDTREVRFWQQSNSLLQAEPIYAAAKKRATEQGRTFKVAKLFWWFNQGANVDVSVTPKPHYGADGGKVFDVLTDPPGLAEQLKAELGDFPFHAFWGPMAGLASTQWIAACAAFVLEQSQPDLLLVYLPHLDYNPQRFGPGGCNMAKEVAELDAACEPLLNAAENMGARVWVVSEYGHCDVSQPVHVNRLLRRRGFLTVRPGPYGEMLDVHQSRAFAVCNHQVCHVYVKDSEDVPPVADVLRAQSGVAKVYCNAEREEIQLAHERSGEIVALSNPDSWFAYPYWLEDKLAPDFARTVDIHRKCGFDPCEMFFDRGTLLPAKLRAALRLAQKKLGFRTLFDVVSLDASLVGGSHGLLAADPLDRPLLIGDGPEPGGEGELPMPSVHDALLAALDY